MTKIPSVLATKESLSAYPPRETINHPPLPPATPQQTPLASPVPALSQDARGVLFSTRYDQDCGYRNCGVLGYHEFVGDV